MLRCTKSSLEKLILQYKDLMSRLPGEDSKNTLRTAKIPHEHLHNPRLLHTPTPITPLLVICSCSPRWCL
jgi:hypothetical protein